MFECTKFVSLQRKPQYYIVMELSDIYRISANLVSSTSLEWKRYMYDKINWDVPMLCIKGARGVGKTTLMLQRMKENFRDERALYISLDNIWFSEHKLFDLADYHSSHGGTHIFIDEVHRYPQANWIQEMKNIYDSFPSLHVVFSGSSLLQIDMSKADLSRRCIFYDMQGMSFREYLISRRLGAFKAYSLEDVLHNHIAIADEVLKSARPLQHFKDYLRHGYYPFYNRYSVSYSEALQQIINTIIDSDLITTMNVENVTLRKFKRLLFILSQMVPYTPNIQKLSQSIETNRQQTYGMLDTLHKAALIFNLYSGKSNMQQLGKPEKIYMENSNLTYALTSNATDGNARETFFANQLKQAHNVAFSGDGDFLIDGTYTIEVGGKGKTFDQIADVPNSFLAIDDTERGHLNRIPLWLFGFLY